MPDDSFIADHLTDPATSRPATFRTKVGSIDPIRECLDAIYRTESCCILATLIRLPGDFDLSPAAN